MESFYEKYKDYSKKQIFEILINKDDYQQEAVKAATYYLHKNGWDTELDKLLTREQQEYETEEAAQSEYYSKKVEFRRDNNYYLIRPTETDAFEARLNELNLEHFKMDNNSDLFNIPYPALVYYFKNKDTELVDKICIDLGIESHLNPDTKPLLKIELIVVIIVVIIGIISLFF
jgi:hypothetical protein